VRPSDPRHHDLVDIVSVRVVGDYTIHLVFDDGYERTVDLSDELWGEVFEPLRDRAVFAQVTIEDGHLRWPNGADLDNEVLRYDLETARGRPLGRGAPPRPVPTPAHENR
jgi:hypothetical protein